MNKLSWFKRLFMSWDQLVQYINPSTENLSTIKELYETSIQNLNKTIDDKNETTLTLRSQIEKLNEEIRALKQDNDYSREEVSKKQNVITNLNETITEIKTRLEAKKVENENMKLNINDKLSTLTKIETTFFAKSGNKGKGELGELQVKSILEKSGLTNDMWTENLPVGNTNVEFAIKSADDGKWIPVDSKVLDTESDEEGNIVVNTKYKAKVTTQAKEVAKYLSKVNTAGYGLLVLQSDSVYIELYNQFPDLFQEILRNHKIHISSPSSFVQFAWSISQIVDIYERVKGDEEIFEEMIGTLNTISDFANALSDTHTKFDIAMNKWMPSIRNKHMKLSNKLEKSGKIKQIKGE